MNKTVLRETKGLSRSVYQLKKMSEGRGALDKQCPFFLPAQQANVHISV